MKYFLIFLLFIVSSVQAKEFIANVPGMVCQMCVQGMKKNFKSVVNNPDKDVIVDLANNTVKVNLKKTISEDDIKQRIRDAGYNAKKITWLKSGK